MLLALRLLYEKTLQPILFPVIGGARKRKLRPPVQPLFRQDGEVELPSISIQSSLGNFYVTGRAEIILSSVQAKIDLGIFEIEGSAEIKMKGIESRFQLGYEDRSSVILGAIRDSNDDEEAALMLFLSK